MECVVAGVSMIVSVGGVLVLFWVDITYLFFGCDDIVCVKGVREWVCIRLSWCLCICWVLVGYVSVGWALDCVWLCGYGD